MPSGAAAEAAMTPTISPSSGWSGSVSMFAFACRTLCDLELKSVVGVDDSPRCSGVAVYDELIPGLGDLPTV